MRSVFRRHARKIGLGAAGLAFAAAAFPLSLRLDPQNRRFEECIAMRLGGESGSGIVHDQLGDAVMVHAVLRTTPVHDLFGQKKGVYVLKNESGSGSLYHLELGQDGAGVYTGTWHFPRFLGMPLPIDTWGRGDVTPDPRQTYNASFVVDCANRRLGNRARWF